jgi:hypothetical protein
MAPIRLRTNRITKSAIPPPMRQPQPLVTAPKPLSRPSRNPMVIPPWRPSRVYLSERNQLASNIDHEDSRSRVEVIGIATSSKIVLMVFYFNDERTCPARGTGGMLSPL